MKIYKVKLADTKTHVVSIKFGLPGLSIGQLSSFCPPVFEEVKQKDGSVRYVDKLADAKTGIVLSMKQVIDAHLAHPTVIHKTQGSKSELVYNGRDVIISMRAKKSVSSTKALIKLLITICTSKGGAKLITNKFLDTMFVKTSVKNNNRVATEKLVKQVQSSCKGVVVAVQEKWLNKQSKSITEAIAKTVKTVKAADAKVKAPKKPKKSDGSGIVSIGKNVNAELLTRMRLVPMVKTISPSAIVDMAMTLSYKKIDYVYHNGKLYVLPKIAKKEKDYSKATPKKIKPDAKKLFKLLVLGIV